MVWVACEEAGFCGAGGAVYVGDFRLDGVVAGRREGLIEVADVILTLNALPPSVPEKASNPECYKT
jgi:hypothetical protein